MNCPFMEPSGVQWSVDMRNAIFMFIFNIQCQPLYWLSIVVVLLRRMFPYVEFSLRGLDPVGLYDVVFDIIPASNKCFKFLNNKWVPIGKKEHEFKTQPFKHPDSPRIGSEWMTRKISFEKVKLSNKPGSKSGIVSQFFSILFFVILRFRKNNDLCRLGNTKKIIINWFNHWFLCFYLLCKFVNILNQKDQLIKNFGLEYNLSI